jgi:biopolymer transport protein ExbD
MAFGGFEQGSAQPMSEINTTPLVDVMLVLLIIFIVCAPLMTQSITVNLPKVAGAPTEEKPDAIQLAMAADGALSWNNEAVVSDGLQTLLAGIATRDPQPELNLVVDKVVQYERIAQVMADVRAAGVLKMRFVMLPGAASSGR